MKNLFIGLLMLAGSTSFANNSVVSTDSKLKTESKKDVKSEKIQNCCTASAGGQSVKYCGDVSSSQACKVAIALLRMVQ